MPTRKPGKVAIQQALHYELGLGPRPIAAIMGIASFTSWQHLAAHERSNVTPWHARPQSQRDHAIELAKAILGVYREDPWHDLPRWQVNALVTQFIHMEA